MEIPQVRSLPPWMHSPRLPSKVRDISKYTLSQLSKFLSEIADRKLAVQSLDNEFGTFQAELTRWVNTSGSWANTSY